MSTIRLKNKGDIRKFFKILAEESVKEAKSSVFDPATQDLLRQSQRDKKAFSSITEIEEEEDVTGDTEIDASASEVEIPEEEAPVQDSVPEIEQVSLDSIRDKIKSMRSGLSVDDSAVQQPMRTYFDLLDDAERKALYAFIDALAGIMTGQSSAESAPDPSDPPYNVQMTSSAGEEEVAEDEVDAAPEEVDSESEDVEEVEGEEEEEKAVPIQVGSVQESASVEKIRNKVRELLKRS